MPKATISPELRANIATAVSALCEQSGKTNYKIAKDTGIQPIWLTRIQNGEGTPSHDLLNQFADYFNVSTDYLYGRTQ